MSKLDIQFEQVIASIQHIDILFNHLKQRIHRISHKDVSYDEHQKFVSSHPYRVWFLVKLNDEYVGSFYLTKENTIGINVTDLAIRHVVKSIIQFVQSNYHPLAAISSIRSDRFAINVSPSNKPLTQALDDIGAELAQITYFLPS